MQDNTLFSGIIDDILRCIIFFFKADGDSVFLLYLRKPANLQAKVSATIRLFGGDSSHMPFFDWQSFQGNTMYPLAIIHMVYINVLGFDDKFERDLCFSIGNLGIIFNSASAQLFPPREKW